MLALKQGVGRLIRDADDTGVIVLCDPRLRSKSYGRVFLNSLPPMRRTQSCEEACAFVAEQVRERLGGKYVSVSVEAVVRAPEVIAAVIDELGKDERVRMKY